MTPSTKSCIRAAIRRACSSHDHEGWKDCELVQEDGHITETGSYRELICPARDFAFPALMAAQLSAAGREHVPGGLAPGAVRTVRYGDEHGDSDEVMLRGEESP